MLGWNWGCHKFESLYLVFIDNNLFEFRDSAPGTIVSPPPPLGAMRFNISHKIDVVTLSSLPGVNNDLVNQGRDCRANFQSTKWTVWRR